MQQRKIFYILCILLHCELAALSQDAPRTKSFSSVSANWFDALYKKAAFLDEKMKTKMESYLVKIEKAERQLQRTSWKKDPVLAKQLFGAVDQKYTGLKNGMIQPLNSSAYCGHLDSLSTALQFLSQGANLEKLPGDGDVQKVLDQYKSLQLHLDRAESIGRYLQSRQELLKKKLPKTGMQKQLLRLRKRAFYFQSQLAEYRRILEKGSVLESKLLERITKAAGFRDYFAVHSALAQLFSLPSGSSKSIVSLEGLQTRETIKATLLERFGSTPSTTVHLQTKVRSGEGNLNELKNKFSPQQVGRFGGNADAPSFKPNTQRSKRFLQRLEYGSNIQTTKASYFFPRTTDIGVSIGYKLNDQSTFGIGASYRVGFGRSWDAIDISHQGVGIRSFVDWKIRGSLFATGGYEQNYHHMIHSIDQLKGYSSWQSAGLLGIGKKYSAGKKLNGEIKLLWDFFSYRQVSRGQAIVFRIGYSFK